MGGGANCYNFAKLASVVPLRRIVYILLLLCLPLYGYAMQGGLPPAGDTGTLVHELQHEAGIQHHHHEEDGSVHYDESDESFEHAQDHSSPSQPVGFAVARMVLPAEQPVCEPGLYVAQAVAEPFLDGPHRPPAPSLGPTAEGTPHA